ncbi:MAG: hypothetical protein ACTSQJ_11815 [Promethearchaeota archaeon]
MIYKVYLIDADNGISLLETTFKALKKIQDEILAGFFSAINRTIDNIQAAMAKGRRINEMTRMLESEDSTIVIYFHPLSRLLFCSISDADDDTDKLKEVIHQIGRRFWKKHQSDLKVFRTTTEKIKFQTFNADIENLTMGGRIAEVFPKLMVVRNVLDKILSMGMIEHFDYQVALKCTGKNSPLKIARMFDKTRTEIMEILKKIEQLDIIKI